MRRTQIASLRRFSKALNSRVNFIGDGPIEIPVSSVGSVIPARFQLLPGALGTAQLFSEFSDHLSGPYLEDRSGGLKSWIFRVCVPVMQWNF
jgi:hypothetical protein